MCKVPVVSSRLCKKGTPMATATVARNVGETGELSFLPMAYGGHCLYVRKCKTGDVREDGTRELGGILLPDLAVENSFWAEVVGIGPRAGRPCSELHRHRFKRARWFGEAPDVGDLVMLPGEDQGIKRSPYAEYEFFVEESVPLAVHHGGLN